MVSKEAQTLKIHKSLALVLIICCERLEGLNNAGASCDTHIINPTAREYRVSCCTAQKSSLLWSSYWLNVTRVSLSITFYHHTFDWSGLSNVDIFSVSDLDGSNKKNWASNQSGSEGVIRIFLKSEKNNFQKRCDRFNHIQSAVPDTKRWSRKNNFLTIFKQWKKKDVSALLNCAVHVRATTNEFSTLNLTSFDVTAYLSSTAYLQDMQR